jgi:hypothetical protein
MLDFVRSGDNYIYWDSNNPSNKIHAYVSNIGDGYYLTSEGFLNSTPFLIAKVSDKREYCSKVLGKCVDSGGDFPFLDSVEEVHEVIDSLKGLPNMNKECDSQNKEDDITRIEVPEGMMIQGSGNPRVYFIVPKEGMQGYRITEEGDIWEAKGPSSYKGIFRTEKHAKSALAWAQISQLMPLYGGEISKSELVDKNFTKYCVIREENSLVYHVASYTYSPIAFHTEEQRTAFMKEHRNLVEEYYML